MAKQDMSPKIPIITSNLSESALYRRRKSHDKLDTIHDGLGFTEALIKLSSNSSCVPNIQKVGDNSMSLENIVCSHCGDGFEVGEKIVRANGEWLHEKCHVCAQCFRRFNEDAFYEFGGRKYCEYDFEVLYASVCRGCGKLVKGRVLNAMNANWHFECFKCESCHEEISETGFVSNAGRALCRKCNAEITGKYICNRCNRLIHDVDGKEGPLKFKGEIYHAYHFNCSNCNAELDSNARIAKDKANSLYCLRCHDKMGIPICAACRRPIEDRVVNALGKQWHWEHFVCVVCEKPFFGHHHNEIKGSAYCTIHYHQVLGNLCFVCNKGITGDVFKAMNKAWCVKHFACSVCDQKLTEKSKFVELDLKPVCKKCFDKFPKELKRRIEQKHKQTAK